MKENYEPSKEQSLDVDSVASHSVCDNNSIQHYLKPREWTDEKLYSSKYLESMKRKEPKKYRLVEIEEEDDDFEDPDPTCSACGCNIDKHMQGCPEDDSPYALLMRRGFD